MSTKVLITGGSGLVGMHLSDLLASKGYTIYHLSRNPSSDSQYKTFKWDIDEEYIEDAAVMVDYVIHLAGASVADKRWSDEQKEKIYSSRIDSTLVLYRKISRKNPALKGFISASAIGYYGADTGSRLQTEVSEKGNDFLANVVADWEEAADNFHELKIPVAKLRIGIVFSDEGGALPQIVTPIKFYAGAPLGSGQQYMSWIHIEDLCRIFEHVLEKNLDGVYNAVAPKPETNKAVTTIAARTLQKPLFLPNVPEFVLKLAFGEMATIILGGSKVSCDKIKSTGYSFKFDEIEPALRDLLA